MSSFGPVAAVYDELMHAVPYKMWLQYYESLLSQQRAEPATYLDVCCGTGLIAEMLAEKGAHVVGIDLSTEMIREAQRKAHLKRLDIEYYVADAANINLNRKFDAAYSFFDSFNYIVDPAHLQRAFQCVAKHLNPGGSFIFDLNTAYAYEAKMFDQRDKRMGVKLKYEWKGDYDPVTRLIKVNMTFWYGGKVFHEVHVQRAYTKDQIVAFLNTAGFKDICIYDSYTLDPPRAKSDRIHVTAILGD
jgi:SAM-dependent methyltransferase